MISLSRLIATHQHASSVCGRAGGSLQVVKGRTLLLGAPQWDTSELMSVADQVASRKADRKVCCSLLFSFCAE